MVQVKLALTGKVLPSVTVTVGEKTPTAFGVPEISPEAGLMDRPVGKPAALQVSKSPFGSVACICCVTAAPTTVVLFPGTVITGCAGNANAFSVRLQVSMSWLLNRPPVAPVNPNHACPPTSAGRSILAVSTGLAGRCDTIPWAA